MNIIFGMRGVGSTARERALALVRQAVAKREAELVAAAPGAQTSQSPQGGK